MTNRYSIISDLSEKIFMMFYVIIVFSLILSMSTYSVIFPNLQFNINNIQRVCFSCLLLMSLFNLKKKYIFLALLIIFFGIASFYFTKSALFLYNIILVLSSSLCYFNRLVKIFFYTATFTTSAVIVSSLIGIIPNLIMIREESSVLRYSLGFNHVNNLGSILTILFFCSWYLFRKKNFTLLIINCLFIFLSQAILNSRTSLITMLIFILIYAFINKYVLSDYLLFFYAVVLSFIVGATIYFSIHIANDRLDLLFSGRLGYLYKTHALHGFTYLGQYLGLDNQIAKESVFYVSKNHIILDNAFGRMMMEYGFISLITFSFTLYFCIKEAIKYDDTILVLIFLSIVCISFSELYPIDFRLNLFPLFLLSRKANNIKLLRGHL
ncbi:oligosaccharide repeat unit polymerase [Enterococcus lactis]|uniref:oligosaccharide repeat unit polymerase n=1 Tax=Enterococcus TaxID=1350 RepID=UPI000BBC93A9|nr:MULTISPECIES: oligosaccharide repeat unit polymerase [Enterococcus]MBD9712907.1 oligosaccharide repeat unit polymerase [Enterococcus faecium]MBD9715277.1 oligosaccharide repeat unit polymerase [Enterococcus faecium]MBD9737132.1 oligosaccharide repeat unit polymerase [Enterococcus faecium]MEB7410923.1 oligosaccharide repeat unit polymerase [Enterococcus lactis]PCE05128.1 hypothetical protein CKY07_12040 [Enterococcus faecium]